MFSQKNNFVKYKIIKISSTYGNSQLKYENRYVITTSEIIQFIIYLNIFLNYFFPTFDCNFIYLRKKKLILILLFFSSFFSDSDCYNILSKNTRIITKLNILCLYTGIFMLFFPSSHIHSTVFEDCKRVFFLLLRTSYHTSFIMKSLLSSCLNLEISMYIFI